MKLRLAVLLGLAAWLAAPAAQGRPLKIVTSSTDLAAIAREIGRERVEPYSFFYGYQEPEIWVEDVFPSWLVRASRADALLRIGLAADIWMDTVIEGAQNPRLAPDGPGYVDVSRGIAVLEVPTGRTDRSLGEIHIQGNPHYLLDPANARIAAENILHGLERVAPADADYFRRNARDFEARLDAALARWDQAARGLRGKKLAAYHKTWSYFARRYGLDVVGYCEPKPGIEPSPADVRSLTETMVREGARLIVHAPVESPRIPEAAAREVQQRTGQPVRVLRLPAHVGGVPEVKDYFQLIDSLIATLSAALR